jgi:hypothetical protein
MYYKDLYQHPRYRADESEHQNPRERADESEHVYGTTSIKDIITNPWVIGGVVAVIAIIIIIYLYMRNKSSSGMGMKFSYH